MKRILFVDDESKILDGIRRMLYTERKNWDMEFALGGEAALQACERGSFDVVISDMRMPGMDGAVLLGHIRDRFPETARMILSGHSEAEAATRALPVAQRFLAKPCNAAELRSAIERVCTLQALLTGAEMRRVIGSVGELPSLSSTYISLSEAVNDPSTPITRITKIIEQDMAMSAKVLQLVNSAFFGLPQKVTSLQNAIGYLGMDIIKNLVLVAETFRVFSPDNRISQSLFESLQHHARRTACIAGNLPLGPKNKNVAILTAFLHDIGKLVLAIKTPDQFCSVLAFVKEQGCEAFEAEEKLLGTSHAEIGAYLLGLWGLPHMAVEAIAHHHHPTRISHSDFDVSTAVYVADLLAHEPVSTGGSTTPALREADRSALETLGVLPSLPEFRQLTRQSNDARTEVLF